MKVAKDEYLGVPQLEFRIDERLNLSRSAITERESGNDSQLDNVTKHKLLEMSIGDGSKRK